MYQLWNLTDQALVTTYSVTSDEFYKTKLQVISFREKYC